MLLPAKDQLKICFAHPAYQMADRFAARGTGIGHVQVRDAQAFAAALREADVVVVSMMWKNDLAPSAKRLKSCVFIPQQEAINSEEHSTTSSSPPSAPSSRLSRARTRLRELMNGAAAAAPTQVSPTNLKRLK